MARLLLLLIIAAGLYFIFRWVAQQPPRVRWQLLAITVALVLILLVLTGRAHWLTAVFAALLPFIRGLLTLAGNWPLLRRLLAGMGGTTKRQAPSGGQTSTVQSQYIRMTLNHDSGDINGEVLVGQFAGQMLDQMDLDALLQLLTECRQDEESVALLQAYLDRVYPDWQEWAGVDSRSHETSSTGAMSRTEALEILGLNPDASEDDIIEAHRRLIQKLHPDRGGSAYLASKINRAKDVLLGH